MSPLAGIATRASRMAQLDGLRALLALWVLFGHASLFMGCRLPFLNNPAIAVDLFIVLSGLFIATTFAALRQRHFYARAAWYFWVRRVMRIWPLYAVMLGICFLLSTPLNAWTAQLTNALPRTVVSGHASGYLPPEWHNVLLHYSLLFGLIPRFAAATALPDWSLSLEFQFYLIYPLLALTWRKYTLLICVVAAALAYVSPILWGFYSQPGMWANFAQPSALPYKLNLFLVGVLAHDYFNANTPPSLRTATFMGIALLAALAMAGFLTTLGIALLIYLLAFPESGVARILSIPPLRFFGEISYTLYLVHRPLLLWLGNGLTQRHWFVSLAPFTRFALLGSLLFAISTVSAVVLYRMIERPGNQLGHRWTRGHGASPMAVRVAATQSSTQGSLSCDIAEPR